MDASQKLALQQISSLRAVFEAYAEATEAGIQTLEKAVEQWPYEPPSSSEVDLDRGRLFHLDAPITAPVGLPAGALAGTQMVLAVVKLRTTTGGDQKILGVASSQAPGSGALCIGLKPSGDWDVRRYGANGASNEIQDAPRLVASKGSLIAWACGEGAQSLQVDAQPLAIQATPTHKPLVPLDGIGEVGAVIDGEVRALDAWDRLLSAAEHQAWVDQHEQLVDDEPSGV